MDFKLDFSFPESETKLSYSDEVVMLGSCFSDELSQKLAAGGFSVFSNPFGTLFHPIALANSTLNSIKQEESVSFVQRNDLFFAWEASGQVFGYSENALVETVLSLRKQLREKLATAHTLFVTFGTAWQYSLLSNEKIVGNCHKMPAKDFVKNLSCLNDIEQVWDLTYHALKELNPRLNIVFTLSPVRHLKDGLIENNRSKARLLEFIHRFSEKNRLEYFPAYEIVVDELRDYRFFKSDFAHPSEQAVDYVWNSFQAHYFDKNTQKIYAEWMQLQGQLNHRSLYAESAEHLAFREKTKEQINFFLERYPEIKK